MTAEPGVACSWMSPAPARRQWCRSRLAAPGPQRAAGQTSARIAGALALTYPQIPDKSRSARQRAGTPTAGL